MLAKPRLLICDELPRASTRARADVMDVLGRLQEETGCALLLITHDLDVVARFADRVMEVDGGRFAEDATTQCPS